MGEWNIATQRKVMQQIIGILDSCFEKKHPRKKFMNAAICLASEAIDGGISIFYMLHTFNPNIGENDCKLLNCWLAHMIHSNGVVSENHQQKQTVFLKCRKNKWRKQLKLNKPGAQLNCAWEVVDLGSRIPGTVFWGTLQCHWFSSAVTIYLLFDGCWNK